MRVVHRRAFLILLLLALQWLWTGPLQAEPPATEPVVQKLEDDGSEARLDGGHRLDVLRDGGSVERLMRLVNDPDPGVRREVAVGLAALGDALAVSALLGLFDDDDPAVSAAAAAALSAVGERHAVAMILAIARDDPEGLCGEIFPELLWLGTRAVGPLVADLGHDDATVRQLVEDGLRCLHDSCVVVPRVGQLAEEDEGVGPSPADRAPSSHDSSSIEGPSQTEAAVRRVPGGRLGQFGHGGGTEALIGRLEDEDSGVRREAADVFKLLGDVRVFEPLRRRLSDDDPGVRSAVMESLLAIDPLRAAEALIVHLEDPDAQVRRQMASALENSADIRAVEPLIRRLDDEDLYVRRAAAGGLGTLGDVRAVEPLIRHLDRPDWEDRVDAAVALGALGDARAVKRLVALMHDADARVRLSAAGALGRIGDSHALGALSGGIDDTDPDVRLASVHALGSLGGAPAVDLLVSLLGSDDAALREAAVAALQRLGDPAAVPPLIDMLSDSTSEVATAAAYALGKMGDSRAVEPLLQGLASGEIDKELAARALGDLGDPRAVVPLMSLLTSDDAALRKYSALALGRLGDPRAVGPLMGMLAGAWEPQPTREGRSIRDEADVLEMVMGALGDLGDRRAAGPLLLSLSHWSSAVRSRAADSLGALGDPRVLAPIVSRLRDRGEERFVRKAAASSLGRLGDRVAVGPLLEILESEADEDLEIHPAAAGALGRLGDRRAVEPLLAFLQDRDTDGAALAAAVWSLGMLEDPRAVDVTVRNVSRFDYAGQTLALWGRSDAEALGRLDFSHPAITRELLDARGRYLAPALGSASSYSSNLLRLVHAAGAYATRVARAELVRLIWGWRGQKAEEIAQARLEADYEALAAEANGYHGPVAANPLVHLFLARLLLADPGAEPARILAAEHHLEEATRYLRDDDAALRLAITWLRGEAVMRRGDARSAYEELRGLPSRWGEVDDGRVLPELFPVTYTLSLSAYAADRLGSEATCAHEDRGRIRQLRCTRVAGDLLDRAEDSLEEETRRSPDERALRAEVALLVRGLAAMVHLSEIQWNLGQAEQLVADAARLPLGWVARQAELHLLEQMVREAVDQGDNAKAHQYAEELALKRYRLVRTPMTLSAEGATEQQREIVSLLDH